MSKLPKPHIFKPEDSKPLRWGIFGAGWISDCMARTAKINSNQKFYSYQTFNNQNNSIIYEENKFFSNKTFDNIFFENKDLFMKKINYFCNNRAAYRELGIPYSLGIILDGPPGTGKTSLIKALANYTGRCVIDINLSKLKYQKELN